LKGILHINHKKLDIIPKEVIKLFPVSTETM
jgi:hypothetical protein